MAEHELAGLRCSEVLELSGAFVLGALPREEADAVRAHLAACPEAHAEVAELGAVLPALFETVEPVEPPAGLKSRILAAAAAGAQRDADAAPAGAIPLSAEPPVAAVEPPDAFEPERTLKPFPASDTDRRTGPISIFRRPAWAALAMAAAVAAVALGAWNIQLRDQLGSLTAYREGVVEVIEEASRPGAQLAVLTAPEDPAGPTGLAAVGADGSVALVMRDLAPTNGTQVYETWLIAGDGNPIPIGSFTVDTSRTASFTTSRPSLGAGVTVALSLEPQPGATAPTVVVAVGAATSQES